MTTDPVSITLREHGGTEYLSESEFRPELAEIVLHRFSKQVEVEWPTPKTQGRWALRAGGWIGHLPLGPTTVLYLEPKVEVANLFRMLALVHDLDDIQFPEGLSATAAVRDVYEQLALLLGRRVLDRARRGLFRNYAHRRETLPFLRGSIDFTYNARRPVAIRHRCRFDEHSANNEDNQILSWTLQSLARGGICAGESLATVRRASRLFHGTVDLRRFGPQNCIGRLYHRLNEDYRPLHGLCRFFLENSGPAASRGSRRMLPFLVEMPTLFERFVARWLQNHLPSNRSLEVQRSIEVSATHGLMFQIDLLLREAGTGKAIAVLDTKYKHADSIKSRDVQQIVAYAHLTGSQNAWLLYPETPRRPLDVIRNGIRVRTAAFDLSTPDLDASGELLLRQLSHDEVSSEPS